MIENENVGFISKLGSFCEQIKLSISKSTKDINFWRLLVFCLLITGVR